MRDTQEPISEARAIRVSLGHMQRLPHHSQTCITWEDHVEDEAPRQATWLEFKTFFSNAVDKHDNQQDVLADAGLANSADQAMSATDVYRLIDQQRIEFEAQLAARTNEMASLLDRLPAERVTVPT